MMPFIDDDDNFISRREITLAQLGMTIRGLRREDMPMRLAGPNWEAWNGNWLGYGAGNPRLLEPFSQKKAKVE